MNKDNSLHPLLTLIGAVAVAAAAIFFVLRFFDNRAHEEKWKDYFECGIL